MVGITVHPPYLQSPCLYSSTSKISPHDKKFLAENVHSVRNKYEVWTASRQHLKSTRFTVGVEGSHCKTWQFPSALCSSWWTYSNVLPHCLSFVLLVLFLACPSQKSVFQFWVLLVKTDQYSQWLFRWTPGPVGRTVSNSLATWEFENPRYLMTMMIKDY